MGTMQTVVLIAHTFIAIMIIVLVLLQRGKGADAGAAFGAGASGTVFGARGSSSFFSRATAVLATAFFASSLALAYMSSQRAERPDSLIEGAPAVEQESPAGVGDTDTDGLPPLPDAAGDGEELPSLEPADDTPAGQAGLPELEPADESTSEEDKGVN